MSRLTFLAVLFLQVTAAFIVSVAIYMLFALLDSDFGIDGIMGLMVIQPIIGAILSVLAIIVLLLLGLPIRLNAKLKAWWLHRPYIPLIGIIAGVILLILSLIPFFTGTVFITPHEQEEVKAIPNALLAIGGWVLTLFSVLHLFPPKLDIHTVQPK